MNSNKNLNTLLNCVSHFYTIGQHVNRAKIAFILNNTAFTAVTVSPFHPCPIFAGRTIKTYF